MLEMKLENLENYLRSILDGKIELTGIGEIGSLDEQGMKDFGYGKPMLINFRQDGKPVQAVLSAMKGDRYGHQFYWDRAAILMFQYETGGLMKHHVRPMGLGYVDGSGRLVPVKDVNEFFILNEKVEGKDYFLDLERIKSGQLLERDIGLTAEFALWLADLHSAKSPEKDLYHRRIRQLIGDSECIFGLIDAYPHPFEHFPEKRFIDLEKKLIEWRWKLRRYDHRLSEVHGDFHPWNVLIREDGGFSVLDRSRGQWGEPADDVSTMTCNYLLYSLYSGPRLSGDFEQLYRTLWDTYLDKTNDREILEVVAPFYVFRGLVIASPEWYPGHPLEVRQALFRFLENILEEDVFDYQNINKYLQG
ncbi:aminoglycoside phosphotransferase family protein [Desulfonatronovibrio hydrogenovorans]|uniref:aminoglycoside phosphotransferase family protein n=1 Tax=Desulfonatronovibrio hydrogenovorans TaxID=53245 RepID=UPI000B117612|nr:aminoglycoside phosphotransferase family protein [Desulfonatronovibrio hydrogenovorans]